MTGMVAYLVCVLTATAGALAHHQQEAPPRLLWRLWRAYKASRGSRVAEPAPRPADGRTRPVPSWAHEQPTRYEEAA